MLALVLALVASQAPQRADSLLAAGKQHFVKRTIGRYAALEAFRAAARLSPQDPEPLYWQMKVGFFLGSDEGEVIARNAILKILAIDPNYEDVWNRFRSLYQNRDICVRADRALSAHPDDPLVMERRAELAIAIDELQRADSLLAAALRTHPSRVTSLLLRAEAGFLAGHDSVGYRWYDSALVHADVDSSDALWERVWMIASPEEIAAHDTAWPGARRWLIERFWATRDPNLLTPHNERIAEHFRRVGYARRQFRLLHPLTLYNRAPRWRALVAQTQREYLAGRGLALAELGQASDSSTAFSSQRASLDARGLIYMRYGAPDKKLAGFFDPLAPSGAPTSPLDIEGWQYDTPGGVLTIGFRRASGSIDPGLAGGDFIFVPTNRRQARSTQLALRTDRTTLPAPLVVRAWSAMFRSTTPQQTDIYLKTTGDSTVAVLRDSIGSPARAGGAGFVQLVATPGRYDLALDADSAGVLGRLRREIVVPDFHGDQLSLSSLLLAPGSALLAREPTLRAMPARLTYRAGTPLAAYVEIYGLAADRSGRSQYHVRYTFAPLRSAVAKMFGGGARPVVFEFDRVVPSDAAVEQLIIEPDKLPVGRYRVTVAVTDVSRNVKSESVALDIAIR